MTLPMTPIQRRECAAVQHRLQGRLAELQVKRAEVEQELRQLGDDMAAEREGAKEAALNRSDDLRALDMSIDAVKRALQAEVAREQDDLPFRKAAAAVDQQRARVSAVNEFYTVAADADRIAREQKQTFERLYVALDKAIAAGVDPHTKHQMLMQYTFEPMLVAAGFGEVRQEWRSIAPRSLEQAARALVRP